MGVFSAVAGNQLPNQLQKRVLPALFHLITPTFSPWTHTSNDSYIYQLSLVVATATVSSYVYVCDERAELLRFAHDQKSCYLGVVCDLATR